MIRKITAADVKAHQAAYECSMQEATATLLRGARLEHLEHLRLVTAAGSHREALLGILDLLETLV